MAIASAFESEQAAHAEAVGRCGLDEGEYLLDPVLTGAGVK
jgi:hypothetical protein